MDKLPRIPGRWIAIAPRTECLRSAGDRVSRRFDLSPCLFFPFVLSPAFAKTGSTTVTPIDFQIEIPRSPRVIDPARRYATGRKIAKLHRVLFYFRRTASPGALFLQRARNSRARGGRATLRFQISDAPANLRVDAYDGRKNGETFDRSTSHRVERARIRRSNFGTVVVRWIREESRPLRTVSHRESNTRSPFGGGETISSTMST